MDVALTVLYTDSKTVTSIYSKHNYTYTITMNVCDDNVGCNEVKNVMCFTTIPTLSCAAALAKQLHKTNQLHPR